LRSLFSDRKNRSCRKHNKRDNARSFFDPFVILSKEKRNRSLTRSLTLYVIVNICISTALSASLRFRDVSRAYRLTIYRDTRTHSSPIHIPSIIHVARKLITRLIHCGYVNLSDSWTVRYSARADTLSLSLSLHLGLLSASLPRNFIRITPECLWEYFIRMGARPIASTWPYYFVSVLPATEYAGILSVAETEETCPRF